MTEAFWLSSGKYEDCSSYLEEDSFRKLEGYKPCYMGPIVSDYFRQHSLLILFCSYFVLECSVKD